MYEHQTYETIIRRALARVPEGIDKRQGSILWDALAPACAELAQMYIELDHILRITYAESAAAGGHSEWLTKRCSEMGVHRFPASNAVRLGRFFSGPANNRQPLEVPVGSRFTLTSQAEPLHYVVVPCPEGRWPDGETMDTGQYRVQCEKPGITGNQLFGRLIPVQHIPGLTYGELADVLIPGEDEESDTRLYARYEAYINEQPYGGNIADYKRKVRAMEGVADCKVYPVWNGGGTVKVVIIDADYNPPSNALVMDVQEMLDPVPFHQLGRGLAPIGHWVTVEGVEGVTVDIAASLHLKAGVTLGQVESAITDTLREYLHELAKVWAREDPAAAEWEQPEPLVVRVKQIEYRALNSWGVMDVLDTVINGLPNNLVLSENQIPLLGTVTLEASPHAP